MEIRSVISYGNLFANDPAGIDTDNNAGRFFQQYDHRVAKINANLGESNNLVLHKYYGIKEMSSLAAKDYTIVLSGYSLGIWR